MGILYGFVMGLIYEYDLYALFMICLCLCGLIVESEFIHVFG